MHVTAHNAGSDVSGPYRPPRLLRGPLKCQQVDVAYRAQGQGPVTLFVEQDGEPVVLLAHHDPVAPLGMSNA
jgi:hypothetical protein